MTDETLGSQMSVRRRVYAVACLAPNWCVGEESHGGGAKIFRILELEWGRGVKRQRRSACIAWTTRWKWPESFRRWDVRTACRRRHRWR